jgi:hypothetical protein
MFNPLNINENENPRANDKRAVDLSEAEMVS